MHQQSILRTIYSCVLHDTAYRIIRYSSILDVSQLTSVCLVPFLRFYDSYINQVGANPSASASCPSRLRGSSRSHADILCAISVSGTIRTLPARDLSSKRLVPALSLETMYFFDAGFYSPSIVFRHISYFRNSNRILSHCRYV